ncbi:MAG: hypothetical protein Q9191_006365 [Dirinaria sp. TL-2023a]
MSNCFTSLVVCHAVLLVHYKKYSFEENYDILCLNFAEITRERLGEVDEYLAIRKPNFKQWLEDEKADGGNNSGVIWLYEFMKEGGLSRGPLPVHPPTTEGLEKTLAALIGLSRKWAVGKGLTTKRSFTRTRNGDYYGYIGSSEYPWYDHPGNSGY